MRKIKHLLCVGIVFCLLCTGLLTGCQLAQESAEETPVNRDKLVGVFVTGEYLDLTQPEDIWFSGQQPITGDALFMAQHQAGEAKLYATLRSRPLYDESGAAVGETKEYAFEDVEGILYMWAEIREGGGSYITTCVDDRISGGHIDYQSTGEGDFVSMEGTIYVSAAAQSRRTFYVNQVYQTEDGDVYAITGNGVDFGVETEGVGFSTTLEESVTETDENGQTTAGGTSVTIHFEVIYPPEKVAVVQFDAAGTVLAREEYAAGAVPDEITLPKDCAYIVVEMYKDGTDGEVVARELYERGANGIMTMRSPENGICAEEWTVLAWEE